jgi:hypothetical protein
MMTVPQPHYLLFSEATLDRPHGGTWRFVLEQVGSAEALSVSDYEAAECPERLELLAVVRGLEALDQPASVTLVTKSRYVSRGLKRGLADWRNGNVSAALSPFATTICGVEWTGRSNFTRSSADCGSSRKVHRLRASGCRPRTSSLIRL